MSTAMVPKERRHSCVVQFHSFLNPTGSTDFHNYLIKQGKWSQGWGTQKVDVLLKSRRRPNLFADKRAYSNLLVLGSFSWNRWNNGKCCCANLLTLLDLTLVIS